MIPTTYLSRLAFDDAWMNDRAVPEDETAPQGGRFARAFARLLAASHPAVPMPPARSFKAA